MPRIGKFTKTWIEQYALSSYLSAIDGGNTWEEVEQGGFTEDKYYLVGRGEGVINLEGMFDDTSNTTHDALKSVSSGTTTSIVTCALGNNAAPAVGDPTLSMSCQQLNYDTTPDLNGLIGVSATFKAGIDNVVEWGNLLADATITANGQQSSYDSGASSSNGGVGYFHITSTSAGDTITILIEDSANDSTWATLITCTLDGTTADAERVEVSGSVDRYVRASYTVTGSAISFPIVVAFHRNP